jgi:hypothetical protein
VHIQWDGNPQGPKSETEFAGIPAGIGIPATFVGINFWGQIPAFLPEFVGIISPIGIPDVFSRMNL